MYGASDIYFFNIGGGEGLCKHESKSRKWSSTKDKCTGKVITALFTREKKEIGTGIGKTGNMGGSVGPTTLYIALIRRDTHEITSSR